MARDFDIAVVGGGPAGHTAALYAARAGHAVCLIQGDQPGGQLTTTSHVENWPGDKLIGGPDLMVRMIEQVEALGVELIYDTVTRCGTRQDGTHLLVGAPALEIAARAVIIATGARAKWLGVDGEERLRNKGVSGCAVCDGFFFKDKHVVVIGGGNTAVEEALYLSEICTRVSIVHRRDTFRAERILQDRLAAKRNVDALLNRRILRFLGEDRLEGVEIVTDDGDRERLAADGAFVAIGHSPATEPFRDWIDLEAEGYVAVAPGGTASSRPGVFAAGDVADPVYRQAITSAGRGCMAALDADRYLKSRDRPRLSA